MTDEGVVNRTILALFSNREDRALLVTVFEPLNWHLKFVQTIAEASAVLREFRIGVVLSDAIYLDGSSWKDLLRDIQNTTLPPALIVADRLADERLWVEVLHLGGFDLLVKPMDAGEVLHVVSSAYRFHENEAHRVMARKPAIAAERGSGTRQLSRRALGAA
jgi:DNA-binding response OmpR family regulator